MEEIKLRNEIAEQLNEYKRYGETHSDAIERLSEQAGVSFVNGEADAEAEQLAAEVMNAVDTLAAEGSKRAYLKERYDVDPAEYDDIEQLRQAIRGDGSN